MNVPNKAQRKGLRIYFGKFFNANLPYANLNGDQLFPDFFTGKVLDSDPSLRLHTRRPVGTPGDVTDYDEYIELEYSSIGIEQAKTIEEFEDVAGVTTPSMWESEHLRFEISNYLTIDTSIRDWNQKTRRVTKPYPKPSPAQTMPEVYARNLNLDPDSVIGYYKFYVTIQDNAGDNDSSPSIGVVVAYSNVNDDIELIIAQTNALPAKLSIYRNPVEYSSVMNAWYDLDYPQLLNNWIDQSLSSLTETLVEKFCNETTEPYDSPAVYLELPALNDCRSRVKFDFMLRRRRIDGVLTQKWLIMNLATNHYYVGLLESISDYFKVGADQYSSRNATVKLWVLEEGMFTHDAILSPNDGDLTAFERDYTIEP